MKMPPFFSLPGVRRPVLPGLVCYAGVFLCATACADDVLPLPAAPKRYDKLALHSPFAPPSAGPAPTAPVATPSPGPSWSDNLTVTSLMQNGKVYTATVMEKDTSNHYLVRSDVENPDNHLMVASVSWADKPDAIKVTVRKGTQFGDLRFDPTAASSSGGSPGLPPPIIGPGGRPPSLPSSVANFRPPPGVPAPPPGMTGNVPGGNILRGRPVIRANPQAPQPPGRPNINPQPLQGRAPVASKLPKDDDDDDDD